MRIDRIPTNALPSAPECLVVVPPSYERSPGRHYPVLYFLHDGYGDGRTLVRRGVAQEALSRMRKGTRISARRWLGDWPKEFIRRRVCPV